MPPSALGAVADQAVAFGGDRGFRAAAAIDPHHASLSPGGQRVDTQLLDSISIIELL